MKRVRIGWAIFCAVIDIALIVWVCIEWSKTGSAWWSLVLAGAFYTVGAFTVWNEIDNILYDVQCREEEDIYYGDQKEQ